MKQVEALRTLKSEENKQDIKSTAKIFSKDMRTNEIKSKIYDIKKWEEKIKRKHLKYETKKYINNFQQYETISPFYKRIYARKDNITEVEENQSNLLENLVELNNKSRPKTKEGKDKKRYLWNCISSLWRSRINS